MQLQRRRGWRAGARSVVVREGPFAAGVTGSTATEPSHVGPGQVSLSVTVSTGGDQQNGRRPETAAQQMHHGSAIKRFAVTPSQNRAPDGDVDAASGSPVTHRRSSNGTRVGLEAKARHETCVAVRSTPGHPAVDKSAAAHQAEAYTRRHTREIHGARSTVGARRVVAARRSALTARPPVLPPCGQPHRAGVSIHPPFTDWSAHRPVRRIARSQAQPAARQAQQPGYVMTRRAFKSP
jgi:hypothetical protein